MDAPASSITESSDSGTPDISVTTANVSNSPQNLTSQPTEPSAVGDTAGETSQTKSFALSSATEEQSFEEQDLAKDGVRTDHTESAEAGDVQEPELTHESGDDMGTCSSSPKASAATSPALQKGQPTASSSPPKDGASEQVGDTSSTEQDSAGQGPAAKDGEGTQAGSPGKSSVSGPNSASSSPGGVSSSGAGGEEGVSPSVRSGTAVGSPAAGASPAESHAAEHSGEDVLALVRQAHEGASRPGPYASSSIGVEPGAYGHHGHGHERVSGLDDSHEEGAMAGFDPYGYPVYGTSIPVYRGSKGSESGSVGGSPRGQHSRSYAGTPTSSPGKGSPPGMRGAAGKKAKALPSDDEIISQVLAEAVQESRLAAARAVLQANAMSQGTYPSPAVYVPAQHTALTQDAARKVKSKSTMQQGGGDAHMYGRPGGYGHGYAGGRMAGAGPGGYPHEEEERAMHAQSLEIERDILGADFAPHGRRSSLTGMQSRSYQAPQHYSPPLGSSGGHGHVYDGRGRQESGRFGPGDAPEHDDILAAAAASVPEAAAVLRPLDAVLRKFSKGLHVLFMGFSQPAKSGRTGHDTFDEQKAASHVVTKAAWLKTLRFLGLLSTDSRGSPALQNLTDTGSIGNSLPASAMAHTSPVMFSKEEAEGVWGDMIRAHRPTIPSLAGHGGEGSPGGRSGGGGGGPGKKNSPALSAANALIGTAAILGPTQPAGPAHALDEARFIEGLARVAVYALTRHPVHAEIYPGDGDKVYAVFSKCGLGHPAEMARRIREEHTRPVAAAPVTSEGSAYEMRSLVETGMGTGPGRQPVQLQGGLVLEAQREARKAMRIAAVQQAKARQHADAGPPHASLATSSSSADSGGHGGWGTQDAALLGTQSSRLTPVGSARQMAYGLNSGGTYQQSYGGGAAPASPADPISMAVSSFEASPSGGSSRGGAAYYGGGQSGGYPAGVLGGLQRAPYGVEPTPITGPDGGARHGQSASPQGQGPQHYYGGSPSQGSAAPSGLPSSSMYDTGRSYFPANPPSYSQAQYTPGGAPVPVPGPQYPHGAFSPPRQAYPAGPDMHGYGGAVSPSSTRYMPGPPAPGLSPLAGGQAQPQGWASPVHMPRGPAMPPGGAAGGSPYVRYSTGGSKATPGSGPGSPPRPMGMQGGMQAQGGRYPTNDSPTGGMTALVSAEEAALQREIDALTAIASDRAGPAGRAQAQRRGSVTGRRASVGQGGEVHMGSPQGRGVVRQGKAAGASVSPGPTGRQGYPSPQSQGLMQQQAGAGPRLRGQAAPVQGLAASPIRSQQYQQQQMVPVGHMMQMAPGNRR